MSLEEQSQHLLDAFEAHSLTRIRAVLDGGFDIHTPLNGKSAVTSLVEGSGRGPVAVIGTGGVGKAIAFALADLGVSEIRIFDTDRAKVEHLVALLQGKLTVRIAASVAEALDGAVGVVNGTPVGMTPSKGTPVPDELLHAGLWVADAVYSPLWTPLLKAARATGAKVMTGRDLAIYQAADAFELFTGLTPSTAEMGIAFDAVMAKRYPANAA